MGDIKGETTNVTGLRQMKVLVQQDNGRGYHTTLRLQDYSIN